MFSIFPNLGLVRCLKMIAENGGDGLKWALFVNDVTLDPANVVGDFTLAGSWAQVTLHAADFVLSQIVADIATIQANAITLTNTSGGSVNVYGFVVVDSTNGILIMAKRETVAPVVVANGGTYKLTPVLGDYSDNSTDAIDGGEF